MLKNKENEEDRWTIAQGQDNGLPLIFRIRSRKPKGVKAADYPNLIGISWPYEPSNDFGMPPREATDLMAQFEELLDPILEKSGAAYLTVVVTGNSVREWQWYSRNPEETMQLVNKTLQGHPPFPVQFTIQQDPEWEAYGQFQSLTGG